MPQGDRKRGPAKPKSQPQRPRQQPSKHANSTTPAPAPAPAPDASPIDLAASIPLPLQQLLLDVFKTALLTLKSHLYQRDFDAAFTDADANLLRAYALRWSAARGLGYAGIFKAVLGWMRAGESRAAAPPTRAVCIGGGAGAEIVALAAAWRDLGSGAALEDRVAGVSLEDGGAAPEAGLTVAAVDIADWAVVVEGLADTMVSAGVPAPRSSVYQPPLVEDSDGGGRVSISFRRRDVLELADGELRDLLLGEEAESRESAALLVTLMFTLNELFSASMAKTTSFLLRMTDVLRAGAVLLVVDSPGSYSSLKLGKGKEGAAQERKYPMKFLLDHTLLSVAEGKWERVLTQDSRWWRRDASRLRYDVGEGAGLEDMRYQVHVYRRL
ncbi:hypothetical protein N7462_005690 [Penicillium macrosclerotiorum]|uniref:uncharacterized protein n=1 Tax=Penicillium macrosclerotiorum TaxID=303699 RepID=UPI00254996A3|nr:uncharacterized protein N7462_005690 [Penicillium macrosclerotiorum]KAJ5682525.1 hypothetical protein N7462_005690 [Penicillium macrosclerotiorum]